MKMFFSGRLFLLLGCTGVSLSSGFTVPSSNTRQLQLSQRHAPLVVTLASKNNNNQEEASTSILDLEEPAGIVGASFFGGSKQKEEFYDPVAEAEAGKAMDLAADYRRFQDTAAFATPLASKVGEELQQQINGALGKDSSTGGKLQYGGSVAWDTCFSNNKNSNNPLAGLKDALSFYKSLDVALVSGTQLDDNRIRLQWQIAVVWPIFWEPRVLLTGFSEVTVTQTGEDDDATVTISKQVDTLDSSSDLLSTIGEQLKPRFWDVYHIGMTPSTEIMPRFVQKSGLLPKSYDLFEIPARLVSSPTQLDSDQGRVDGNAQMVPNHAFSCVIKTMGPQKQVFVPASPLEVQINGQGQGKAPRIKWSVPLSVALQSSTELPQPGEDPEARPDSDPTFEYEFQARRLVATVPYGGTPQDVEIADVRKQLYDAVVVKDNMKPKLDEQGRPQFFFLQNNVKACSTEEGLGMCVYEWRPKAVKPNEVGIELELS